MPSPLVATVSRDFSLLLGRRGFWWFFALWAFINAIIFFTYLENFLAIQPTLRAKGFRYGVTDLVIIPYLKSSGTLVMGFIICLSSRLFYGEHFSPFAALYRSLAISPVTLVMAKWAYVAVLSLTALGILILPVAMCKLLFDYNGFRVVVMAIALFMLLLATGGIAMLLSQVFTQSILTALVTLLCLSLPEIAATMINEPGWLTSLLAFFSPLTHIQRMATGLVALSDGVFFVLLLGLITALSLRQYKNSYLFIH